MKCLLKNVFIDELFGLVDKDNNTYHSTIKIKPTDIKANTYICSNKEIKHEDPKFKIDNIIRISKCKTISEKNYTSKWLEGTFVIKKVKNTVS